MRALTTRALAAVLLYGAPALAGEPAASLAPSAPATADWPVTEGAPGGGRYSPLTDITRENVKQPARRLDATARRLLAKALPART